MFCSRTHCTHRQLRKKALVIQHFWPPSKHLFTVFRYGGASPLMFLASWLDRRSANGREGTPLSTSFQVLTDGAEWRCPSSRGQATRKDDPSQPAGTFGVHRGVDLKHQSYLKSSVPVAVSNPIPSRFYQEPLSLRNWCSFHQLLLVESPCDRVRLSSSSFALWSCTTARRSSRWWGPRDKVRRALRVKRWPCNNSWVWCKDYKKQWQRRKWSKNACKRISQHLRREMNSSTAQKRSSTALSAR